MDAAALNKSTNPGSQSKQQIGRVARAREAVDNMLKRWLVPACACVFSYRLRLNVSVLSYYVALTRVISCIGDPCVGGPV